MDINNHTNIINYFIEKYNYESYLEIGIFNGKNYEQINCKLKECCDITNKYYSNITYVMPSDEMFAKMPVDKKYDIIFIDGMHDEEFVDRDIVNSLKHLNKGGVILLHDVIPYLSNMQVEYECYDGKIQWTGNVWKSIVKLVNKNIEYYTLFNRDYGLGIIKYMDNPYKLNLDNEKTHIRYDYIFDDKQQNINHIKLQGKYALHLIDEQNFYKLF